VRLFRHGSDVVLEISDRGRGFDPATSESDTPGQHLGLLSMAERVWHVDGAFTITSERGGGTCIRAAVPLARAALRCGAPP